MKCVHCQADLKPNDQFCGVCGQPVEASPHCPGCGAEVKSGQPFCEGCGYNLQVGEAVASEAKRDGDGSHSGDLGGSGNVFKSLAVSAAVTGIAGWLFLEMITRSFGPWLAEQATSGSWISKFIQDLPPQALQWTISGIVFLAVAMVVTWVLLKFVPGREHVSVVPSVVGVIVGWALMNIIVAMIALGGFNSLILSAIFSGGEIWISMSVLALMTWIALGIKVKGGGQTS